MTYLYETKYGAHTAQLASLYSPRTDKSPRSKRKRMLGVNRLVGLSCEICGGGGKGGGICRQAVTSPSQVSGGDEEEPKERICYIITLLHY